MAATATLAPVIDFTTSEARITRARHHQSELEQAVESWHAGQPYHRDLTLTDLGSYIERAEYPYPVPGDLRFMVSDAAHEARAALDNLVGAIRPDGPTDVSGFPIKATPEAFAMSVRRELQGVPHWAVQAIRDLQPFSGSVVKCIGHQLLLLHNVARLDRHRAPALHASLVRIDYVEHDGGKVQMRGDWKTWAEVEYEPGRGGKAHFKVKVEFTDGPFMGWEVTSGTGSMVSAAEQAIAYVKRSRPVNPPTAQPG